MEVLYFFDTDTSATLLLAPYESWEGFCRAHSDQKIEVEHWNSDRTDIEQHSMQLPVDDWFKAISKNKAEELMRRFVDRCLVQPAESGARFFA